MCGFVEELSELLTNTELDGFEVGWERTGALMLTRSDVDGALYASPDWEHDGTIAIEVEYEGYCDGWTLDVTWPNDLDACAELWRCNVRGQLAEMREALERLHEKRRAGARRVQEMDERRARAMRCPMCGVKLRRCSVHEPGCVHCDDCWWCGHESDLPGFRRAS